MRFVDKLMRTGSLVQQHGQIGNAGCSVGESATWHVFQSGNVKESIVTVEGDGEHLLDPGDEDGLR